MNFQELGVILKTEREAKGLTIEAVMESTKISRINLVGLENGDRSSLPHAVYAKGFVKSYARLLGLDAEELAMVVDQEYQSDKQDGEDIVVYEVSPAAEKAFQEADAPQKKKSVWPSILGAIIVIGAALALVVFLNKGSDIVSDEASTEAPAAVEQPAAPEAEVVPEVQPAEEQSEAAPAVTEEQTEAQSQTEESQADQPAAPKPEQPQAQVTPAPEQQTQAQSDPVEKPKYDHVLVIRAITDKGCWIGLWKGDETKMAKDFVLTKGEPLRLMFNSPRRIRIGNVAGVTVMYNGEEYPITDAPGNIKTLRFGFSN